MIPQKLYNFHEQFSHNKIGGLWLSTTVHPFSQHKSTMRIPAKGSPILGPLNGHDAVVSSAMEFGKTVIMILLLLLCLR